jgi:hypothetical protein
MTYRHHSGAKPRIAMPIHIQAIVAMSILHTPFGGNSDV